MVGFQLVTVANPPKHSWCASYVFGQEPKGLPHASYGWVFGASIVMRLNSHGNSLWDMLIESER